MRKSVLVFIDWFDPGFKAGGPIRSAVNFAKHMQHDMDIFVFTSDRDLGSAYPYDNITTNEWITYDERVRLYYCSPEKLSWQTINGIIGHISPDYIYLNSLFSKFFTIYPLLISRQRGWAAKVVLAPRGMLRSSALAFKPAKKKIFLAAFRWIKLPKYILFHTTDDTESKDVLTHFGPLAMIQQAPNLSAYVGDYPGPVEKLHGNLNIIFVGRIHPIKNLDYLLERLRPLKGNIQLSVIGSEEDKAYLEKCKAIVADLPHNIKIIFEGERPNHELPALMKNHHIFVLPTQGENFGHAIFEGLTAGKPVLISDQTPWRDLTSQKAGWDIALTNPAGFEAALQEAIDMDQHVYNEWSKAAWELAWRFSAVGNAKAKYLSLFA